MELLGPEELSNIDKTVRLYLHVPEDPWDNLDTYSDRVVECLIRVAEYYNISFKDGHIGTLEDCAYAPVADPKEKQQFIEHHKKTWYQGPGFQGSHDSSGDIMDWIRYDKETKEEKFFNAEIKKCYDVDINDPVLTHKFSGILIYERKFHAVFWKKLLRWRDTFLGENPGCHSIIVYNKNIHYKPERK